MAKTIHIFNRAHTGYRRANIAFDKGDNQLDNISQTQLAAIEDDPRLMVQSSAMFERPKQATVVAQGADANKPNELSAEQSLLVDTIRDLAEQERLELTQSGKVEVACLEAALPAEFEFNAKDRDIAWAFYQAALEE